MKKGVTLLELVVTLACIGILIGILLPAVQSARESSRQLDCQNRMRQVCLGAILHDAAHRYFPSGGWGTAWIGMSDRGYGKEQPGSWMYSTLTYVEKGQFRNFAPSVGHPLSAQETSNYLNAPIPLFCCPSRALPEFCDSDQRFSYRFATNVSKAFRTDFCVNAGPMTFPNEHGPLGIDVSSYSWPRTDQAYGMCFVRSQIRHQDVLDGASNVIFCGEKWAPARLTTVEMGFDQSWAAADTQDVRRSTENPPAHDGSSEGSYFLFGSQHSGGSNFSFVDGSTRRIAYSIHPDLFKSLGDRQDGKPNDHDD